MNRFPRAASSVVVVPPHCTTATSHDAKSSYRRGTSRVLRNPAPRPSRRGSAAPQPARPARPAGARTGTRGRRAQLEQLSPDGSPAYGAHDERLAAISEPSTPGARIGVVVRVEVDDVADVQVVPPGVLTSVRERPAEGLSGDVLELADEQRGVTAARVHRAVQGPQRVEDPGSQSVEDAARHRVRADEVEDHHEGDLEAQHVCHQGHVDFESLVADGDIDCVRSTTRRNRRAFIAQAGSER